MSLVETKPMQAVERRDSEAFVVPLRSVSMRDVARVGGKNASLGELLQHLEQAGVRAVGGFATDVSAYASFVAENGIAPIIESAMKAYSAGELPVEEAGKRVREAMLAAPLPAAVAESIRQAYRALARERGEAAPPVAVRSSATAEDLPEASFAGQQETFLNVRGEAALLDAVRRCFASLYTDRAISYRANHGIDQIRIALSAGVQPMVRSDRACAGVMFSVDTETGFPDIVVINGSYGLGETVVQGSVDPDEYRVFKPLLADDACVPIVERKVGRKEQELVYGRGGAATQLKRTSTRKRRELVLADHEVLELARAAVAIERHYGRPIDIEWAKDGVTGELYVLQARPETVQARRGATQLETYELLRAGERLLSGAAIGEAIAVGPVCVLHSAREIGRFVPGSVLVSSITDPDWVPIMKRAAAVVTDHGGRTSHAAIVSRELGLPAIVGTGSATSVLADGDIVTVSCAEGDVGNVYAGRAEFRKHSLDVSTIPATRMQVMLNVSNPAAAFGSWRLPSDGVGLARIEFVISHDIKAHPLALARPDSVVSRRDRSALDKLTSGWSSPQEYFVAKLSSGIARIAAAHYPRPVIVRTSDFKTNEYAQLLGGAALEPKEENPMLGWRGASRYYTDYRDGFALECRALKRVREELGFRNVVVMIPFCRTPEEADAVLEVMAANGLARGENGLEVYVMCEIPSNVVLAEQFAARFDGFSIGSNDLTQLVLGVDRDSAQLKSLFDESNEAVTRMIRSVIDTAHRAGRKVGLCGQAPSDKPAFVEFLVDAGIDSVSVTADSFIRVKRNIAAAEQKG